MNRRHCLKALAGAPLIGLGRGAQAAQYPDKPVRILVAYGAGGTGDLTCRVLAQALSIHLKQQFIVDNRPGAGGIVAARTALAATPDGYTLLQIATGTFAIAPSLFKHLPFDPLKDFVDIGLAGTFAYAFAVNRNSPISSMADLVARARANPGKINVGTVIVGSGQYLAAEYFKAAAGIDVVTIPYQTSGEVIAAIRGGDVQVGVETLATLAGQIKGGALRAVAVTSHARFSEMPDVPSVAESGFPQYDVSAWNGFVAPAKTPLDRVATLNAAINTVLKQPDVRRKFADLGFVAAGSTPEGLASLNRSEIARWGKVIDDAKIPKQ
jgi:tripartite-type tricarboxylate transporter receptor subunit TctC